MRRVTDDQLSLREFIHLDYERVRALAAQLGIAEAAGPVPSGRAEQEALYLRLEPALLARPATLRVGADFDYARWRPETFADGQFVLASGAVRMMDYTWLSMALGGLPAVLRKMSKIEMAAFRGSEEGRRMSKSALQQRSLENQSAIAKVEEMKMEELGDVVRGLYDDTVRVKIRPSREQPAAVFVGSAAAGHFYDSPAALSQKYGIEIDAGWTVLGQLNVPNLASPPVAIPVGNQMEDAFEAMALLMNNAFRLVSAPTFPLLSITPIAIYRNAR